MPASSKKTKKGGPARDSSSWLGRYLSAKALRQQARNENPNMALATAPGSVAASTLALAPVGLAANEIISNQLTMPTVRKGKKNLTDAERTIQERTWGEQLLSGLKQSLGWGLGGALGGGLSGAAYSKLTGKPIDPASVALWAAVGGGSAGATPVVSSIINKIIVDKMSTKSDRERAKDYVAKHPNTTSIPLGDIIGAARS